MTYIFDICNTLFDSNTTYDFIRFFTNRTNQIDRSDKLRSILNRKSFKFWYLLLKNKATGIDWHKTEAVKCLEGAHKELLFKEALNFFDEVLIRKKIKPAFELLNKAKEKKETIYLASSTIDPVASAISSRLGVQFFSTRLEYENDICLGKIKIDISGLKHKLLEKIDISAGLTVVTDNFSDYRLVEMAKNRYVVVNNLNERHKWKAIHPIFLEGKI